MNASEVLQASEKSALSNNQIVSHVVGKKPMKGSGKLRGGSAAGFITAVIVFFAVFFNSGTLIPSAISERLIEETDVQYADAVESKKIVFQQALQNGNIPEDTAQILNTYGVLVGYEKDGQFIEANKHNGELSLKLNDIVIPASGFIREVSNNQELYNAFNSATYSRAAYYYDEDAKKVFRKIGTSRNNFTSDSDFDEVMRNKMQSGSEINVNSVSTEDNEYIEDGVSASSESGVKAFIDAVRVKNTAATTDESALNTADTLKVADTISKEQRSSLFFSLFMENISKMKAGDGNDSKINEAMNFLYENSNSKVVDVETGELVEVSGTALDSPSLYAVLANEKIDPTKVQNYSSDRILKTIENKINNKNSGAAITTTVASTDMGVKGSIGRFINSGIASVSDALLEFVAPTVSSSLVDNSYDTIKGVNAGEFLVEGAVNTGKMLAKASGATAGDAQSVTQYAKLNEKILAMDARVDRANRSPFDITSKNTFLGSIMYNFAISERLSSGSLIAKTSSVLKNTSSAIASLIPGTYADEVNGYLSSFGSCETYKTVGAVGTAQCSEIETFDTSTLNDPFNDIGFKQFVENNTTLNDGIRVINDDSVLADFIKFSNERITPLGVTDGGILSALNNNASSVSFISDILDMIKNFLGTSDNNKRIATGAAFVNSSSNIDWQTYKYAQRYVSLARATAALRQHTSDSTAYNSLKYFEGEGNPVVAFLDNYYKTAKTTLNTTSRH